MVKIILIKSPDEWATTKQACRDELVVYLCFSSHIIYFALLWCIEHCFTQIKFYTLYIYIYVWIYENGVKDWIRCFLVYFFFISLFFFSAFAMTAACKSYLAWNVETPCRMFHLLRYFFHYLSTPPFSICVKFSPGYTRLNSVRAVTLIRSDRLAFCICCLKEVCPRTSLSPMKAQV